MGAYLIAKFCFNLESELFDGMVPRLVFQVVLLMFFFFAGRESLLTEMKVTKSDKKIGSPPLTSGICSWMNPKLCPCCLVTFF